jgi:hypothetical protein
MLLDHDHKLCLLVDPINIIVNKINPSKQEEDLSVYGLIFFIIILINMGV